MQFLEIRENAWFTVHWKYFRYYVLWNVLSVLLQFKFLFFFYAKRKSKITNPEIMRVAKVNDIKALRNLTRSRRLFVFWFGVRAPFETNYKCLLSFPWAMQRWSTSVFLNKLKFFFTILHNEWIKWFVSPSRSWAIYIKNHWKDLELTGWILLHRDRYQSLLEKFLI